MKVKINFHRIGQQVTTYTEGLVNDDGIRLHTYSIIPIEYRERFSDSWRVAGLIGDSETVYSVTKFYFYYEFFDILAFHNQGNTLLGYYCDIATPLEKRADEYYLTDLFLDLWVSPQKKVRELDWEEFEQAAKSGLLTQELRNKAVETMHRLKTEIVEGIFPTKYIEPKTPMQDFGQVLFPNKD